jgi:hypothetical protein
MGNAKTTLVLTPDEGSKLRTEGLGDEERRRLDDRWAAALALPEARLLRPAMAPRRAGARTGVRS